MSIKAHILMITLIAMHLFLTYINALYASPFALANASATMFITMMYIDIIYSDLELKSLRADLDKYMEASRDYN